MEWKERGCEYGRWGQDPRKDATRRPSVDILLVKIGSFRCLEESGFQMCPARHKVAPVSGRGAGKGNYDFFLVSRDVIYVH